MDQVLEDIGYHNYLEDGSEEGRERWDNVTELRRLASEYQTVGLQQFLEDRLQVSWHARSFAGRPRTRCFNEASDLA